MKRFFCILLSVTIFFLITGCGQKKEKFNKTLFFPSAQITMQTTPSFFVNSVQKMTFSYGTVNISSFCYECYDNEGTLTVTTFPFTAEEYKTHFKSPFSDFSYTIEETYSIIETENPYIVSCYKSVAKTPDKQYETVYLVEFGGAQGCLVLRNSAPDKDYGDNYLKSLIPVLSYREKEPGKQNKQQEINDITAINTEESVLFNLPADFTYYKEQNGHSYRLVGSGTADNYLYLDVSSVGLTPNNKNIWAYNYGFDRTSDNKIYNINTNKLYYINEWESVISTLQGDRIVRFSYIDTINQSDYLEKICSLNFIEE